MAVNESRADEDLTARARIRDAALREFAEHGVSGATIRGIARAAGVSPGLVQHHFGSKEALRRACDEYVMAVIRETKQEALKGGVATPGFLPGALTLALSVQRYVARALVDGSEAAARLFDDAVAFTEDIIANGAEGLAPAETDDPHAYAAVMCAMAFGSVVLHEHLTRNLGADPLTPAGYPRMALAMLDILTDDLMDPGLMAQARAALAELRASAPGEAESDPDQRIPTSDAAAREADSDPPAR
ncbi:TetR family transcriptional regulator [Actinomadura sp. NBRC 104425]|uniref:TetR/AcrR family transcriptional regulator n=1 Tax=Actinomadura sp. NBRC 104425 TaxID=3032204 RepID=UPI00249FCEA2|nr:TetR/AcrR family transcriptional regulator [Actinomadura sp. NBRC 104425]GLZ12693.1 TetR family transcriptional regulator [Actinomadura sp. NBRC 104425]